MRGLVSILVLVALAAPVGATEPWSLTLGHVADQGKGYEVRLVFPKLSWPGRPEAARAFNRAARQPVDAALADFRKQLAENRGERPGEPPWGLQSGWETAFKNQALISGLTSFSSFTGGAHPNPWLDSLNFDVKAGRVLALGDLFRAGSGYLKTLSEITGEVLRSRQDVKDMLFPEGWEPKAENYQVWTLGPKGLTLIFPPYQVAPYVAGPQEVLVPWGRIAALLRPEGVADRLARGQY